MIYIFSDSTNCKDRSPGSSAHYKGAKTSLGASKFLTRSIIYCGKDDFKNLVHIIFLPLRFYTLQAFASVNKYFKLIEIRLVDNLIFDG